MITMPDGKRPGMKTMSHACLWEPLSSWHFYFFFKTNKKDGGFRPFALYYSLTFCRSL
jgi:hypothetical protein